MQILHKDSVSTNVTMNADELRIIRDGLFREWSRWVDRSRSEEHKEDRDAINRLADRIWAVREALPEVKYDAGIGDIIV